MEIAVIGGGHGCHAAAADLSERGHRVRLWRRDREAFAPTLKRSALTLTDTQGTRDVSLGLATTDLAQAVTGAELVLIPLPATAQVVLGRDLAPLLTDGQVVFLPPGTFGSYILANAVKRTGTGARVTFAETGTLPYLARKQATDHIAIRVRATRLPTGVLPTSDCSRALDIIGAAYPSVEPIEDVLSAALMNAGPIIHPPLILMNAGPLEHFKVWDIHNEGTQPSVRRVTDALDAERVSIREALGYRPPHFPIADHYDDTRDEWMYGNTSHEKLTDSGDWREDIGLTTHRYMLEDVALGLAFLVSVGVWAGTETPVARGLLALGSAVVGKDFRTAGRTLETLGLADLSRDEMHDLLQGGPG